VPSAARCSMHKMRPRLLCLLHHHFSRRRVLHFDPVLRSTRDGFCDVIVNLQPGDVVFCHACQLGFEGAPASRTRPSGENRTSSSTLLLDRTWNEISIHHVILDFLRAEPRRFLSRNRPFRDGHHSDRSHKSDILLPLRSLELRAKELPMIEPPEEVCRKSANPGPGGRLRYRTWFEPTASRAIRQDGLSTGSETTGQNLTKLPEH
jgi:hypothetical protein